MDAIRKIEAAIQVLESQRQILGDEVVEASLEALNSRLSELQAAASASYDQQRKLATVLFTDIVGHTRLVQDLDPEENMEIIEGALVRLADVVKSYGGHIARFQGDGFKAIFGLPAAHESDPENAIHAGLGLIAAAEDYSRKLEAEWNLTGFNVRVGIATGLVVAGGPTEAEDTINGLVVNLAARLERAAKPGSILISQRTYQHTRGIFDVEPKGPIPVKGFPEPVPVYEVKRAKQRAFRMRTRGMENLETKTIGRDRELQVLQETYLNAAAQQQTTLVMLVGEAGVGKSRLVYEFTSWLELRPEMIWYFKGRASQHTQGIPQSLLRDMLAGRFQILDSDPLAAVREKFVAGVCEFLPDEGEMKAHILGTWLGYDFRDSLHLEPIREESEQIKNRATLYMAQLFTAIAERSPAVILLDDIHWADGSSLEAVMDLARRRSNLPLLIVCLCRPSLYERRPEWGEKLPAHTRLDLAPLSEEDTRSLVKEILRLVSPLPEVLLHLVSNRSEGNPFYAEEMVKMLIDDGVIRTGVEKWQVVPEQLLELKVPDTLTGVLQARLDKLEPKDKQAAQQAAVIGHIFWDKALAALAPEGVKSLPNLHAKEFIFPRDESAFAGTAEYIFKHAILRDVTYETVLKRMRVRYHALVADWLAAAAEANKRSEEYAALIGQHYQLAGNLGQAASWYGRAGLLAVRTNAHEDAVRYLGLALEFAPVDDIAARFALLDAREKVHHLQGNRAAQREDLGWITALAGQMGESAQAKAALRQATYAEATSDYPAAIFHAGEAAAWGERAGDLNLSAEGHWVWGNALQRQGQFPAAKVQFESGLRLAQNGGDLNQVANCLNGLGNVTSDQGDFSAASEYYTQALTIRKAVGDRNGEGIILNNLGILNYYQQDYASAREYYRQSLAIHREIGNRFAEGVVLHNLANVTVHQGDYSTARKYNEQSLMIRREIGDRFGEGGSLSNLGLLAHYQGDFAAASGYMEQSLMIQRGIGDRWGEGITLNDLGALALEMGDLPLAESSYRQALAIREDLEQSYHLVEDWAGLARLKLEQGEKGIALEYARRFLDYLGENPRLDGAENPLRAFRLAWDVFAAQEEIAEADAVLRRAAEMMQTYLDKNSDPALQEMYLDQPNHSVLWAAWIGKTSVWPRGIGE